ncbi:MAG: hypothetical protein EON54_13930 [Alcaligenaceae bacterium]|nr:MAG: hypothetical protein EON54_13930 [Alcaligenaceae bacterium]
MSENLFDNTRYALDEDFDNLAGIAAGLKTALSVFMERHEVEDAADIPGELGEFVRIGARMTSEAIVAIWNGEITIDEGDDEDE